MIKFKCQTYIVSLSILVLKTLNLFFISCFWFLICFRNHVSSVSLYLLCWTIIYTLINWFYDNANKFNEDSTVFIEDSTKSIGCKTKSIGYSTKSIGYKTKSIGCKPNPLDIRLNPMNLSAFSIFQQKSFSKSNK